MAAWGIAADGGHQVIKGPAGMPYAPGEAAGGGFWSGLAGAFGAGAANGFGMADAAAGMVGGVDVSGYVESATGAVAGAVKQKLIIWALLGAVALLVLNSGGRR